MFKVSHSKVKTWRRCRYLYDLKYVRKLRRKYKSRPQVVGSIVHEAIEAHYKGKSVEDILKGYEKAIGKMFQEEIIEFGLENAVEDSRQIVKGYFEYWKNDGVTYLAVELEFDEKVALEIYPGIVFIGKVDAIVQLKDSKVDDIWIFERKTCKRIPDERTRATDVQTVLYFVFLTMMRRKQGRRILPENWPTPRGVIWDYVRSKAPSIPHQNKPKKGEEVGPMSRAACDTTWTVYEQALLEAGLDPDDYQDVKEALAGAEDSFFRRIRLPFSKSLSEQVYRDFIDTVIEMRSLHGIVKDRNLTYDCSRCEFYNLCQAELHGLDTDILLKKDYEVKDESDEKEVPGNDEG